MTSQDKFFSELRKVPHIARFWDQEKRKFLAEEFENEQGVLCKSEIILTKFFAAVWFHNDRYRLDITDIGAHLDEIGREIISNWLSRPYWP